MKLLKLLYFAQGWSLAWTGRELFADEAEAWERGPVFPLVRKDVKYDRESRLRAGDPARLSESERLMTEAVADHYGHLSGADLSAITHSQAPWLDTYEPGRNATIDKLDMLRFFSVQESPRISGAFFPPPPVGGDMKADHARFVEKWAKTLELLGR
nr:type II toxin-antitoxin system antitoxin SocA domain-containing protein [Nanchangia anserum]